MAITTIRNMTATKYGSNELNKPIVKIGFELWNSSANFVDMTKFQYTKLSDIQSFIPTITTHLDNWTFNTITPAHSILYVRLTRIASDDYQINLYNDNARTHLLAQGNGNLSTTITFTPVVDSHSNLNGTVDKNTTTLTDNGDYSDFTLDNATVWHNATVVAGTQSVSSLQTRTTGRSYDLYWDSSVDLPTEVNENYVFRLEATETIAPFNVSSVQTCIDFLIYKQIIEFDMTTTTYTNVRDYEFNININTGTATHYKSANTLDSLDEATWDSIEDSKGNIYFSNIAQEEKIFFVMLRDEDYNCSSSETENVIYHIDPPANTYLKITGSTNSSNYTGVIVGDKGSFTPTDVVTIDIFAEDLTPIEYFIDGNIQDAIDVRTWLPFNPNANTKTVRLQSSTNKFLGVDEDSTINITFRDEAQNTSSIQDSIRFNTKIFKMSNAPLNKPSSSYDHTIMEVSSSGDNIVIPRQAATSGQFVRKWNDMFYPATHSYPTNPDGSINESQAISMAENSNALNDAVDLSGGAVNYDSEGRVTTVDWTYDGSKDYFNMESSYEDVDGIGLRYWVIDNTGYGEFQVEFEHFRLDSDTYGPPYNPMSPYQGDQIVIYDASAPGCVTPTISAFGDVSWTLTNSAGLEMLQAYTGSGTGVYSFTDGSLMNANTNGGFSTPTISTTTKICIILYSDASITASGFKIKAGKKHNIAWENWQVDEENGELWIHKYPTGESVSAPMRAIYNYYDTKINIDYEDGSVTFSGDPGTTDVKAYYTYYDYVDFPPVRTFILYNDDLVSYLDAAIYQTSNGVEINKNELYQHPTDVTYPDPESDNGKITNKFTIDKDRAIIEFADGTIDLSNEMGYTPKGRMFADYQYHTYLRLSNDGNGNFVFNDETLVADDTPQYKDYSFGDIKIINEGDAILEQGKLKFLPRGYDNSGNGIVDQVLDLNRPWDVQEGTSAETHQKTACQINQSYVWEPTCSKSQAKSILSNWQDRTFGFDLYPRQVAYGRIVL